MAGWPARVTQDVLEVLVEGQADSARVTQDVLEVLCWGAHTPEIRVATTGWAVT